MPAILGFARTVQGAIILALSAALVALSLYVWGFNIGPIGFKGLVEKLERCQAKVKSADEAAKRQKQTTATNVSRARETMKQVEGPAKRVETAPLPGNCQTPREILGADL